MTAPLKGWSHFPERPLELPDELPESPSSIFTEHADDEDIQEWERELREVS